MHLGTARPSDRDSVGRAASFLIAEHKIKHVLLLAHQGCGYYRHRYPTRSLAEIEVLQRADLEGAQVALLTAHPKIEVLRFFARVADGHITFEAV